MHYSYDRRPAPRMVQASDLDTVHYKLNHLLRDHGTQLEHNESFAAKAEGDNQIRFTISGTTNDGRTFHVGGSVWVGARSFGYALDEEIVVEGTVDMGPLPPALVRVKRAYADLMRLFGPEAEKTVVLRRVAEYTIKPIEDWEEGKVVDKKRLRSSMASAGKDMDSTRDVAAMIDKDIANRKAWNELRVALVAAGRMTNL